MACAAKLGNDSSTSNFGIRDNERLWAGGGWLGQAPEGAQALAAFATLKGDVGNVVIHDLVAVGEESGEIRHAERIRGAFVAGIEFRIDEPHADEQATRPQRQIDAAAVVGAQFGGQGAHAGVFEDEIEGAAHFEWRIKEIADDIALGEVAIETPGFGDAGGGDVQADGVEAVLHCQSHLVAAAAAGNQGAARKGVRLEILPQGQRRAAAIPEDLARLVFFFPRHSQSF
jgi:hypothetical protein